MKDLTTGSPLKQILLFALPIMLGNICHQLYNVIDIWVVGHYCGKEALAAVGGGTVPLISLVTWFVFGIFSGNTIVTGQYYGAKNMEKVR
ncbi:MAG: MATE family efflux transporter, partial [Lentisphaeria bacterium]|nr:MATE family efflux transporter [Lentisphaeria bacterium]